MSQSPIVHLNPVYTFFLDGSAPAIALPEDIFRRALPLAYEIEDEDGRKICGSLAKTPLWTLPRLNAGYHHLKISGENFLSEALLLVAPPKMYSGSHCRLSEKSPANNFKALRRQLSDENLTELHYSAPFPCDEDLAVFFRLIQKKNPQTEENVSGRNEQALYLALQSQMPINKDFNDWANNHYDYNKISSFKTKEFAKRHPDLTALGELALKEVDDCLRDITSFCRRRNCPVCVHLDMPLAVNIHSFKAWRNRKILLAKQLSAPDLADYVPYNPQALENAFYEPFILLLRQSMAHADVLCFDNPLFLRQISCQDAPFPDKKIEYDLSALLAMIAIESNRFRCLIAAADSPELTDEFKNRLTALGICLI